MEENVISMASQVSTIECYLYVVASCGEGTDCKKDEYTIPHPTLRWHQKTPRLSPQPVFDLSVLGYHRATCPHQKNVTDHTDVCCGATTSNGHSKYY